MTEADQNHTSSVVVFADLDDSLIQTTAKLPPNTRYSLGATDKYGATRSHFTAPQKRLLQLFQDSDAIIIPTTGRNTDALNRVNFTFSSYSIVSHGALVLTSSGQVCPNWLRTIEPELSDWPELLDRTNREINDIIAAEQLDARSRTIVDQGIPAYVSIKGEQSALEHINQHSSLNHLFLQHTNGHNHALLPPYTRKARAIKFLYNTLELSTNDLVIGIGDSLSDLSFLQGCQFAMIPTNSQIMNQRLRPESLHEPSLS